MDLFFVIALLGPLLGGFITAALGRPWWYGALPFVLYFGVWGLIHDWFVLDVPEDRIFHVVLSLIIVGMAALGGVAGRRRARRSRQQAEGLTAPGAAQS
jgi:hypothetical protein